LVIVDMAPIMGMKVFYAFHTGKQLLRPQPGLIYHLNTSLLKVLNG